MIMSARALVVTLVGLVGISMVSGETMDVYLGTYTGQGGSQGIYRSTLDTETGQLSSPVLAIEAKNPSFLEIAPNGRFLYAVCESGRAGTVMACAIDPRTGELTLLNTQSSQGSGPCHVNVDHAGKNVLVANYGSGSAAVLPIGPDGHLGEATAVVQHTGSGVNRQRQQGPHAHSINVSADDRFAFVADLGIDKLMIYKLNIEAGTLVPNDPACVELEPGAGPRHFTFTPDGRYAYVINELNGTVTAFAYDKAVGRLTTIQTVSTLPNDFDGRNTCAEIRVHPNGRFLYGSNRGHDSIAVYRIDSATGRLTFIEHETTDIKTPRNFNIDPTGTFCLVANMDGANVVVFRIDPKTGELTTTGNKIAIDRPVCIRFRRAG